MKKQEFPSHVSGLALAKLLSVNQRTITRLSTQGILRKTAKGYDVIESIAAHRAHAEGQISEKAGKGEYGKARSALMIEKARMARMAREKMEGSSIPAQEVEERWVGTCTAVKNKFLGTPNKLAAQLATESTAAGCQRLLRDEIHENLEDLSRGAFIRRASK
jgi:hypothetical protein